MNLVNNKSQNSKFLIVIVGPTAIGKSTIAIKLGQHYNTEIISVDSRQIYKEMKNGTAVPSVKDLNKVRHHLIQTLSIHDYYNAYKFEQDALKILEKKFKSRNIMLAVGGSMLYIDALCNGLDVLPTIDIQTRNDLLEKYEKEGIIALQRMLKLLDRNYYHKVDLKNPKRILHALEICLMTGRPYSELRNQKHSKRPFNILKIGLNIKREKLYRKINTRVDQMIDNGLIEEAKSLYLHKQLNALNTVGYKELFDFFDNNMSLDEAIKLIKRNSRHYAKRQLSWFNRDEDINWFSPKKYEKIIEYIDSVVN